MSSSVAGRHALVKVTGAGVAFSGEAFTDSGDHQTYQITDATKQVWDATATITVLVGGLAPGEAYTINRLLGQVIFAVVNAGRGAVTASGTYLPVSKAAKVNAFAYAMAATLVEDTDFDSAAVVVAPGAPTVALAGSGAGNVNNGTHYYRVTFVTADGETEGGTVSAVVTVADHTTNGEVAVTAIPIGPNGTTARKLYRTVAGATLPATFDLVTTINDNSTTTYTDNIADGSLTTACPTSNTTNARGQISRITALRDVTGTLGRFWSIDTYFRDTLLNGNPVVIEFWINGVLDVAIWALLDKDGTKAAVEGAVMEDVSFQGTTDVDGHLVAKT